MRCDGCKKYINVWHDRFFNITEFLREGVGADINVCSWSCASLVVDACSSEEVAVENVLEVV